MARELPDELFLGGTTGCRSPSSSPLSCRRIAMDTCGALWPLSVTWLHGGSRSRRSWRDVTSRPHRPITTLPVRS